MAEEFPGAEVSPSDHGLATSGRRYVGRGKTAIDCMRIFLYSSLAAYWKIGRRHRRGPNTTRVVRTDQHGS